MDREKQRERNDTTAGRSPARLQAFFRLVHRLRPFVPGCLFLGLCLLTGCESGRPHLDQALMANLGPAPPGRGLEQQYVVHCPDVLELTVSGRPDLTGRQAIGPDGRIDLGDVGRLRVEGRLAPEVGPLVAEAAGVRPDKVQFRLAEYNSQQIYLFGQVVGLQRSVPYQGPETVLELLRRAGGITPGAAPNIIYVVRSHVAEGQQPEVFHIELKEIVRNQDQRTNLRLQPFDRVYVGENRESSWETCVAPCLRPLYEMVCGLWRHGSVPEPPPNPKTDRTVVQKPPPEQGRTFRGNEN